MPSPRALGLASSASFRASAAPRPLRVDLLGFHPDRVEEQSRLEARFDALLDAAQIGAWIERLSARPHPVGSPYGKENAEFMLALFGQWGWDAEIEPYEVLFPTPKVRLVELLEPESLTLALEESAIDGDPVSTPERRAAAGLQRLLDRRRRHRRAGVRQLRGAGRLPRAREARHQRRRQDRSRPLLRLVARHQAEGRGREGSDRLPDLLAIPKTTASSRATSIPRAASGRRTAPSAARSPTCRSSPAIR